MEDEESEVSEEGGISRLCNSILTAVCVAPIVILGMCLLLGWNERRAVCESRAILQGKDEVNSASCDRYPPSKELVHFSCDLKRTGLQTFSGTGDFASSLHFQGLGLKTQVEILQCVETVQSETKKNKIGGGSTTTKQYSYSKQWVGAHQDSTNFHRKDSESYRQNCGVENPDFPSGTPTASVQLAESAMVGAYTVPRDPFLRSVPLDTPVLAKAVPRGWKQSNEGEYAKGGPNANNLGDVRVRFYGNDWNSPGVTVLGMSSAGVMSRWIAPDSWLCSGFKLGRLRMGEVSEDKLFADMHAESSAMTWLIRFIALVVMWMGFCCIFKPLEVAADCVPCIGPYLGDSVSCVISCVTCPLALACGMGVAGIVWVAMRPILGIGMMLVCCLCFAGAFAAHAQARSMLAASSEESDERAPLTPQGK